jgi:GH35 family endo-1,4-beta-xylanase
VYADNDGQGYSAREVAGRAFNFCLEAASSRVAAVSRAEERFKAVGTRPSADYRQRMSKARTLLADARAKAADAASCARPAMASLADSLHAGEMLVIEHARAQIAARGPRKGFRFGCNGFRYPQLGEPYAELFTNLLNFVTLPFYRGMTERVEGQRDFSAAQKILERMLRSGVEAKGHPLLWFHRASIPEWLKGKTYDQVRASSRDYILDAVRRFKDRVHVWDVINEAHDWANDFSFDLDQLVELTRLAADATREADPKALRIVNSCCTWSEYVADGRNYSLPLGRPGRSVLSYVRDVLKAGVDFEVIGLQMYYPARDMFEIDRHLDMFCRLGKPVHITELGVSSSIAPVKVARDNPGISPNYWHGREWSEAEQAEWVEAYYTICYAKPAIEAITWWDFCDPAFIPHGGFADENLRPKEAYHRLKKLVTHWR